MKKKQFIFYSSIVRFIAKRAMQKLLSIISAVCFIRLLEINEATRIVVIRFTHRTDELTSYVPYLIKKRVVECGRQNPNPALSRIPFI
jgi:hypothetical protein